MVDLTLDPRWELQMPVEKDWELGWLAEKTDKGTRCSMSIKHKDKEIKLGQEAMMEIAANALQVLFLAADIPNEAVPEPLRGHLQPAGMWAQLQARNLMAFMIQTMTGQIDTGDGKTWKVDWGYEPNILSSNIVTLKGERPQTWDGSFRPVMRMTQVVMPQFTGESHDPQRRDDTDSQLVGANAPEAG